MRQAHFAALVAGGTALAAGLGWIARPGRTDVAAGAALGTGVAGLSAAVALAVLTKIRESGGERAASRLVRAFAGLMLARMVGYLAFLGAAVVLRAGDPLSVCIGLVAGTVVFQTMEVLCLRKLT